MSKLSSCKIQIAMPDGLGDKERAAILVSAEEGIRSVKDKIKVNRPPLIYQRLFAPEAAKYKRSRWEWEKIWGEKAREADEFMRSIDRYTPEDVMSFAKQGLTRDQIKMLNDTKVSAEGVRVLLQQRLIGW